MYFKGKEGCPAGGLLCKSKTDFHKAKQVHSVWASVPTVKVEGAYEFAAKLQPAVVFRAGGQSRPPLQASWKRCIIKHSLLLLFYRIMFSSASGETSSVMPKRSMA